MSTKPFFISIPHAGELVPPEANWLLKLAEPILMCDSDRYVDKLYQPVIDELHIPNVIAETHRYVVDLNRWPEDVDAKSVEGHATPAGTHPKGFHWYMTTKGQQVMTQPMSRSVHETFTKKYFEPFHADVKKLFNQFKARGAQEVFHLDAHSMPSLGEAMHVDPGERRAQIVISDFKGKSCKPWFLDLVVSAYEKAGFQIKVNWPYIGGRITQTYGKPELGQHTIQVEMNRELYMNEDTKALLPEKTTRVQQMFKVAVGEIYKNIPDLK